MSSKTTDIFIKNPILEVIRLKIKSFIDDKNLTVAGTSRQLEINRTTLINYIEGKYPVKLDFLLSFSDKYKVPMSYWFEEDSKPISNSLKEDNTEYKTKTIKEMERQLEFMRELAIELKEENKRLKAEIRSCKETDHHQSKQVI